MQEFITTYLFIGLLILIVACIIREKIWLGLAVTVFAVVCWPVVILFWALLGVNDYNNYDDNPRG